MRKRKHTVLHLFVAVLAFSLLSAGASALVKNPEYERYYNVYENVEGTIASPSGICPDVVSVNCEDADKDADGYFDADTIGALPAADVPTLPLQVCHACAKALQMQGYEFVGKCVNVLSIDFTFDICDMDGMPQLLQENFDLDDNDYRITSTARQNDDGNAAAIASCVALDNDGDGFLDKNEAAVTDDIRRKCDEMVMKAAPFSPYYLTAMQDDCGDTDPEAHPGAEELCDGIDNDCDGTADNGCDADADGYCRSGKKVTRNGLTAVCTNQEATIEPEVQAEGEEPVDLPADPVVAMGNDCDDLDPQSRPGAQEAGGAELCDGQDNDCNGFIDLDEIDADQDGFLQCEESAAAGMSEDYAKECDQSPLVNQENEELANDGVDNNCDGIELAEGAGIFDVLYEAVAGYKFTASLISEVDTGSLISFYWDFGDGGGFGTSELSESGITAIDGRADDTGLDHDGVVHEYKTAGSFDVTFMVINDDFELSVKRAGTVRIDAPQCPAEQRCSPAACSDGTVYQLGQNGVLCCVGGMCSS